MIRCYSQVLPGISTATAGTPERNRELLFLTVGPERSATKNKACLSEEPVVGVALVSDKNNSHIIDVQRWVVCLFRA